jgi:hypothetical protein
LLAGCLVVAAAVVVALVIALFGRGGVTGTSNLESALSYVPAQATNYELAYLNWSAIERSMGVTLAPSSSAARLGAFETRLLKLAPIGSDIDSLGPGALITPADLVWETELFNPAGTTLAVARLGASREPTSCWM